MAEPSKDTDQSMEDILQSIKRIIADESDPSPAAAGSDVLELTELLAEDVAVPDAEADEPAEIQSMSIDEIMAAPMSAAPQAPPPPPPAPKSEPITSISAPAAPAEDKLMSDSTLAASVDALHALAHTPTPVHTPTHNPAFRSGTTIEDLVIEAIRPMLKDWLDSNLPSMVKSLVEREIRRLSSGL